MISTNGDKVRFPLFSFIKTNYRKTASSSTISPTAQDSVYALFCFIYLRNPFYSLSFISHLISSYNCKCGDVMEIIKELITTSSFLQYDMTLEIVLLLKCTASILTDECREEDLKCNLASNCVLYKDI